MNNRVWVVLVTVAASASGAKAWSCSNSLGLV